MVKIENKTNRLVSIRLNNGRTVHLQPRPATLEIADAQVMNNKKIEKLKENRVIALQPVETKPSGSSSRTRTGSKAKSSSAESMESDKKEK